jgi:hypothetical protein
LDKDERLRRVPITLYAQQARHGGGIGNNNDEEVLRVITLTAANALRRQNKEMKNELLIFKTSTNTLLSHIDSSFWRLSMVSMMIPQCSVNGRASVAPPNATTNNNHATEAQPSNIQHQEVPSPFFAIMAHDDFLTSVFFWVFTADLQIFFYWQSETSIISKI